MCKINQFWLLCLVLCCIAIGEVLPVIGGFTSLRNYVLAQDRSNTSSEIRNAKTAPGDEPSVHVLEKIFTLKSLICNSTTTAFRPDSVYLVLEDKIVWGPRPIRRGNVVDLSSVSQKSNVKINIQVFAGLRRLYMGSIWETGDGSLSFSSGLASYTLNYQVQEISE